MQFEKQQYQQDCVDNIMQCLQNVNFATSDFSALRNNINQLYKEKNYHQVTTTDKQCLDVLMETGTGKTFTYIKTIFELNKQFNQTKFIIVVPRVAIKLGTLQNIKLTKNYFFNEYRKHLNIIDYPNSGLSAIHQDFIHSRDLSIIITTSSAFNSEGNNINQRSELLAEYSSTWDGIAAKNPIIIIDEPHLLKGPETKKGLDQLENSLMIRFGATYPKDNEHKLSNVAYILDSISAFNQYLVKRIGVNTIFTRSEINGLHIYNIKPRQSFDIAYNINEQLHKVTVMRSDDLGAKTGIGEYVGKSVTKINSDKIYLDSGTVLNASSDNYTLTDEVLVQMIRRTISLHFEKDEVLFNRSIKALSLFFIPYINDFRGGNPRVKTIFEQQYKSIRNKFYTNTTNERYKNYLERDFTETGELQVHEGYFSGDRGSASEKEADGINQILNEKEKLLSFTSPLRFIFSVWALQEGWDNPNIFTICKLSSTSKDTSRRQQVGRGLRIAVNQQGNRLTYRYLAENESEFFAINSLDMVVAGQEQDFIHRIQQEIQEASFSIVGDMISLEILQQKKLTDIEAAIIYTMLTAQNIITSEGSILQPILPFMQQNRALFTQINDARFNVVMKIFSDNYRYVIVDKNKIVKKVIVRQQQWKQFKQLWEIINRKSKIVYKNIHQDEIIAVISDAFNHAEISPISTTVTKEIYNSKANRIEKTEESINNANYFNRSGFQKFIMEIVKSENIPLLFVVELFNKLDLQQFYNDPKRAEEILKKLIKDTVTDTVVQHVHYQFCETAIYPNSLQPNENEVKENIECYGLGHQYSDDEPPGDEFLYDTAVYDSQIEKDSILHDPTEINHNTITVFAKLPAISIPTPHQSYNPDFAYLIDKADGKQLFLVVETKGYRHKSEIPESEQKKIKYAEIFFKDLQAILPNIDIRYKTRIQRQELTTLLQEIIHD